MTVYKYIIGTAESFITYNTKARAMKAAKNFVHNRRMINRPIPKKRSIRVFRLVQVDIGYEDGLWDEKDIDAGDDGNRTA